MRSSRPRPRTGPLPPTRSPEWFPSLSSLICCVFVARYLEKQEFLERVDWREHENELENKKDVGWKGLN